MTSPLRPLALLLCLAAALGAADEFLLRAGKVIDGKHDLYLSVRRNDDGTLAGFATTPTWNQATHAVQLDELRWDATGIAGDVICEMRADAWVPAKGARLPVGVLSLRLEPKGEDLLGDVAWGEIPADGKMDQGAKVDYTAKTRTVKDPATVRNLALLMPEGIGLEGLKPHRSGVILRACLVDGAATAASLRANRMSTWASWVAYTDPCKLVIEDGKLVGEVVAKFEDGSPAHTWRFFGLVVGEELRGTYTRQVGDGPETEHPLAGSVVDAGETIDLQNADYELCLVETKPPKEGKGSGTIVWLAPREGWWKSGFAITPTVTRANHEVTFQFQTLKDGTIQQELVIHRTKDSWTAPQDTRRYTMDLERNGGSITGTLQAIQEDGTLKDIGLVRGLVQPPPVDREKDLHYIQCEDMLSAESHWQSRCFLGYHVIPGKPSKPAFMRSDHPKQSKWSGRLVKADVSLKQAARPLAHPNKHNPPPMITGTLTTEVESTGPNKSGSYTFALKGKRIGDCVGGTMVSSLDGKECKRGRYWGIVLREGWDHGIVPPPFVPPNKP